MASSRGSSTPVAVRFGTSGWRGILGEEVTFPALRAVCRCSARWFEREAAGRRILIGWDTRFASQRMAAEARLVLEDAGLEPILSRTAVPTPVVAHAIRRRRAAGALMFTASHNPPEYHGLKVFGAWGGSIGDADARWIEARARRTKSTRVAPGPAIGRRPARADWLRAYRRDLLELLDGPLLRRRRLAIVYDAMHGCGAGVLDEVLSEAGLDVTLMRREVDPLFGGGAPDPVPERLAALARRVRSGRGELLGLATDGDADRFGAVDESGRILNETRVLALLMDHLARTRRIRRGIALGSATGSLVARVARHHGLAVIRTATGFKNLSRLLASGEVEAAGEESGGFALSRLGRDKDGILAGCLLAEIASADRGGLRGRMDELERRFGRSICARRALPSNQTRRRVLERLRKRPPRSLAGRPVLAVALDPDLRLEFDDGFAMLRASGTEPVLRLHAEAGGPRKLTRRLDALAALLG